jgi:HK97 family phage major capsid protein
VVRTNHHPLENIDAVRSNLVSSDELRSRAMSLIEDDYKRQRWEFSDVAAEAATVRAQTPQIGRHILLTGGPEYRDAFRTYLQTGDDARFRDIRLAVASGGYLLPYVLDPTIVLTNSSSANPFRRVSRVVQTTSNAWQGVSSAGVNAALVAEAATAADAAPSDFAQIQVVPKKFAAWVLGTYEALDDTDFGTQLPGLLSDAKDRIESSYFATGSGTNAPQGVASAMTTASRVAPAATGTAFNGTASNIDVYNLQAALPPRFRKAAGAAFMGNIVQLNKVRAIDQYGGGSFWANFTSDTPASLLGQPIYEASDFSSTTTGTSAASGTASITLMYGDFGQFIIADRVGVSMLYDPLIKGTGASAQLPAGEAGWYMFWRVGSQISTTAGFRYLTIS